MEEGLSDAEDLMHGVVARIRRLRRRMNAVEVQWQEEELRFGVRLLLPGRVPLFRKWEKKLRLLEVVHRARSWRVQRLRRDVSEGELVFLEAYRDAQVAHLARFRYLLYPGSVDVRVPPLTAASWWPVAVSDPPRDLSRAFDWVDHPWDTVATMRRAH